MFLACPVKLTVDNPITDRLINRLLDLYNKLNLDPTFIFIKWVIFVGLVNKTVKIGIPANRDSFLLEELVEHC
jgi:hypothetical protein